MNLVVVGLGSNIDPKENIRTALRWILELGEIQSETDVLRTEPIGAPGQEWFMNCAVLLETELSLEELAVRLRDIEGSMGRPREGDRSGPRTIDLDVLVWNGTVVDEDVYSRPFLGDAVRELSPEVGGPLDQASAQQSVQRSSAQSRSKALLRARFNCEERDPVKEPT